VWFPTGFHNGRGVIPSLFPKHAGSVETDQFLLQRFTRYDVIHKLTPLMMAAGNGNLKSLKLIMVMILVKSESRKGSTFV
jgi:hypothetical protein